MRVLVKRDASSSTLVDLGEDDVERKLRSLVAEHGAAVTNEDGFAIELPPEPEPEEAPRPRKSRREE